MKSLNAAAIKVFVFFFYMTECFIYTVPYVYTSRVMCIKGKKAKKTLGSFEDFIVLRVGKTKHKNKYFLSIYTLTILRRN